jgi:hemoglobin
MSITAFATILPRTASVVLAVVLMVGCGSGKKTNNDFFTSGSRDADQRADQRMAKAQQLEEASGSGKGDKSSASSKEKAAKTDKGENKAEAKRTLYERLGNAEGIAAIVDDWITRALADPRVNWERKGVTQGGFSIHRNKSVEWQATPEKVKQMKIHIAQAIAVATGGPPEYGGREISLVHRGLHITNPEFDAALGDLKASLDKFQIPNNEQKELLAVVESTRPQISEQR